MVSRGESISGAAGARTGSSDLSGHPSWSDEDQAGMVAHGDGVEALLQRFVEQFDAFLSEHADCRELLEEHLTLGEHRNLLLDHLRAYLRDPRGEPARAASARVGYAHIRAEVTPSAYLPSYNLVFPSYHSVENNPEVRLPEIGTLRRRWLHDVCATLDYYHEALGAAWEKERTRLKSSLADTETRASLDDLTGVLRREPFVRVVERSRRQGLLLVLDLDRFKSLNDREGHLVGDEALSEIGGALLAGTRGHDAVARLGGDEFGIWIEQATSTSTAAASRLLSRMEEQLPLEKWDIGISAGCVACPAGPRDFLDLYHQADMAMYRSKRARALRPTRVTLLSADPTATRTT